MKLYNNILFRYLLTIEHNGFLGLIYTVKNLDDDCFYQKFSIFSYLNSTDSELFNLHTNSVLKVNDYINNETLENNIFGVDLYGIKILKLPSTRETGVYFFSKLKNKIIFENDILPPDDDIYFVYDYNVLKNGSDIYTIEMAGIVQEKEYSKAIEFTLHNQFYGSGDPEIFYKRKIYIGRSSFYNYTIPDTIIGKNNNTCTYNCQVCYDNNINRRY